MDDVAQELVMTQLKNSFGYHTPDTDEMRAKLAATREVFLSLAQNIVAACPEGRERSVALTHLETAAMWAIKSIVLKAPLAT